MNKLDDIINNNSLSNYKKDEMLSCFIISNNKMFDFVFDVFYLYLTFWKKNYPNEWKPLIDWSISEELDKDKRIIIKIGFNEKEKNTIYKLLDNKHKLYTFLKNKFLKVTATIYNLSYYKYIYYYIKTNESLKNKFVNIFKKLFLISDITWNDIDKIYTSIKNDYKKRLFNQLIYSFLVYGDNDEELSSLYTKNMAYSPFIREELNKKRPNPKNLRSLNDCNKSAIDDKNHRQYSVYNGKNEYKIDNDLPYALIMKRFNSPYLSGPSGSTFKVFYSLFDVFKYPKTTENMVKTLLFVISDFVPLYHTLPEILLISTSFFGKSVEKYKLGDDPHKYVIKLIKKYLI